MDLSAGARFMDLYLDLRYFLYVVLLHWQRELPRLDQHQYIEYQMSLIRDIEALGIQFEPFGEIVQEVLPWLE